MGLWLDDFIREHEFAWWAEQFAQQTVRFFNEPVFAGISTTLRSLAVLDFSLPRSLTGMNQRFPRRLRN